MTNLTEQQIADGWKHISEIVNEPDGFVQLGDFHPYKPNEIEEGLSVYTGDIDCYPESDVYRRLVPTLPNQVVISREDAEVISSRLDADSNLEYDIITRLRAKLEGK